MDQYICTRGDTDYPLQEVNIQLQLTSYGSRNNSIFLQQHLKYWRFRMYLLPKEHAATKKIIDLYPNPTVTTCDIYTESLGSERQQLDAQKQQIEEFIRFLETYINKIKKSNCGKSTRVSKLLCSEKDKLYDIVFAFFFKKLIIGTSRIT